MTDDDGYERITTDKLAWEHVGRYIGVFYSYKPKHPTFTAGILVSFDHHVHDTLGVETLIRIGVTPTQIVEITAHGGPIAIARKLRPILREAGAS